MYKTITVQIGNSDDKLSQLKWSDFVESIQTILNLYSEEQHFFGGSENWKVWQNVAWVIIVHEENIESLKKQIRVVRRAYEQDSVAVTIGDTEFV